jgi:hypothetical protein
VAATELNRIRHSQARRKLDKWRQQAPRIKHSRVRNGIHEQARVRSNVSREFGFRKFEFCSNYLAGDSWLCPNAMFSDLPEPQHSIESLLLESKPCLWRILHVACEKACSIDCEVSWVNQIYKKLYCLIVEWESRVSSFSLQRWVSQCVFCKCVYSTLCVCVCVCVCVFQSAPWPITNPFTSCVVSPSSKLWVFCCCFRHLISISNRQLEGALDRLGFFKFLLEWRNSLRG